MTLEEDMRIIGPGIVEAANRTPARQPPYEMQDAYILTKDKWIELCEHLTIGCTNQKVFLDSLEATHTSPQAPERYTGTCAMQEKCNDYADFCESIMEELTENEGEDPPCPIKCAKRVNPQQESIDAIRTEAAKAREQVLKEIISAFDDKGCPFKECTEERYQKFDTCRECVLDWLKSLRESKEPE